MLLLAPTGVAAVNIDAKTIHSGLGINCKGHFFSLNGPQNFSLRNKLLEIVMFPAKMSKISRKLFILFNERLIRDFG